MDVLCVAAHPDDEVIGVGGTLARHAHRGDDVHVCILADGVTSRYEEITEEAKEAIERRRERARAAGSVLDLESLSFHTYPDNAFDTVPLLDLVQTIESEIAEHNPHTVYTHHYGDLNIDHVIACRATVTATRPLPDSTVERVLAFETLSATEWSIPAASTAFQPQRFVDIEPFLERKLSAITEYEHELRSPPHPRSVETIESNARVWGSKAGVAAAEPFEVLRDLSAL